MAFVILGFAALFAGGMNALAGGGSFVTLAALLLTGIDARTANITSTVALFPGQITAGLAGRRFVTGAAGLPFLALFITSLVGGIFGALLLLATPAAFFARLVPWLVLFATAVFAWGSFGRGRSTGVRLGRGPALVAQFGIAVYGGYFGGGIGFLMLAYLTMAGLALRPASATKNVLAGTMNASAVVIFLFSGEVRWLQAAIVAVAAMAGGLVGAWLLKRINEKLLRGFVVMVGIALTVGLFFRAP